MAIEYTANDLAPSVIEVLVKIIIGISGLAVLIGIVFVMVRFLGVRQNGRRPPPTAFGGRPGLNLTAVQKRR